MKENKKIKKNNSDNASDTNIEFLKKVKKEAKEKNISYELRVKNYTNPSSRLYTYGIR